MLSFGSSSLSTSHLHPDSLALSRHAARRSAELQAVRQQGRPPRTPLALRLRGWRAGGWKLSGAKS